MKTLGPILKELTSGERDRNFSDEEYQALIKENPDLAKSFSLNYDGSWDFIGKDMQILTDAIVNNTNAILADS
jgi:hypothetical protein